MFPEIPKIDEFPKCMAPIQTKKKPSQKTLFHSPLETHTKSRQNFQSFGRRRTKKTHKTITLGPVHTTREEFENGASLLRSGLPSTLICQEKVRI